MNEFNKNDVLSIFEVYDINCKKVETFLQIHESMVIERLTVTGKMYQRDIAHKKSKVNMFKSKMSTKCLAC